MRFKGVIFDLDGVVTNTAVLHAQAWKLLFDQFFEAKGIEDSFQLEVDYAKLDGLPRIMGVKKFLESRQICLEEGSPTDGPAHSSIHALANRKNEIFNELLEKHGVTVFDSTVALIRELKQLGVKLAVASSSKNCKAILKRAKLAGLFDTCIDGTVSQALGLKGKPNPDIFVECCYVLNIYPCNAIVVEDAESGVEAAKRGDFGLVVGIDRKGNLRNKLLAAGATVVVRDLGEVSVWSLNDIFLDVHSCWSLTFHEVSDAQEKLRESLCALGNGYFMSRGAVEEATPSEVDIRYPGTYLSGGYNRLESTVNGNIIENEDLVNFPNWTRISFRQAGKPWFSWSEPYYTVKEFRQNLNVKLGVLVRRFTVVDKEGNSTTIVSQRLVHMKKHHLGAIKYTVIPQNWTGTLELRCLLDGSVTNQGVHRYRGLNCKHLKIVDKGDFSTPSNNKGLYLTVETTQSALKVSMAMETSLYAGEFRIPPSNIQRINEEQSIGQILSTEATPGKIIALEKFLAICSSRDKGMLNPQEGAITQAMRWDGKRFYNLMSTHINRWKVIWNRYDVQVELENGTDECDTHKPMEHGDRQEMSKLLTHAELMQSFNTNPFSLSTKQLQFILRFHTFHLAQICDYNNIGLDVSIPARGLHGEAYRGHIFWDEMFCMPVYTARVPDITRSLLLYRFHRLDAARDIAKGLGVFGACFPWQSGATGKEETPKWHFNPLSKTWGPDCSSLQLHVNIAVFYNIWEYFASTGDIFFMEMYGAEMMLEIARFWAMKATFNPETQRYEILGVMGPDEFHEKYPDKAHYGLNNNAYTNVMVAWCLDKAIQVLGSISSMRRKELISSLHLHDDDFELWQKISTRMTVIFHQDYIISQFEGYDQLKELDWDAYRNKYGNIQRMDRILKAEGDSPDRYKVSKQADVCMLFFMLSHEELIATLKKMGYPFTKHMILKNIQYYLHRTSHGSTLSLVVYSSILFPFDAEEAWRLYKQFLWSDICDIQKGTTGEGIHVVPMACSINLLFFHICGLRADRDCLSLDPKFPEEMRYIKFRFQYKRRWLQVEINRKSINISCDDAATFQIPIYVRRHLYSLSPGSTILVDLV